MPIQDTQIDIPVGRITGVNFSIFSDKHMASFKLLNKEHNTNIDPLESNHLGVVYPEDGQCQQCNGTCGDAVGQQPCPGHFGTISLDSVQIFHPLLIKQLAQIMSCFCPTCAKLKYRVILEQYETERDKQDERIQQFRSSQPKLNFITALYKLTRDEKCCDSRILFKDRPDTNEIIRFEEQFKGNKGEVRKEESISCAVAIQIISRYQASDLFLLGLENNNPVNLVLRHIPVLPKCCRPTILMMGQTNRDQLTDVYQKLVQIVQGSKLTAGESTDARLECQRNIATAFASVVKTAKVENTAVKQVKGITDRLRGKYGILRNNCMGKRVNFCSRSVISGDPTISIDQLGVPRSVAARLSFPETVNARNKEFLQKLVHKGTQYPGANLVQIGSSLKRLDQATEPVNIKIGDIVHRHLLEGDYVMFNRQPSLHKMSFMSHRVKVLPYSTFRLNLCAAKPYNADFDGDEMNMHEPQALQSISEMAEIMLVSKQIVSCKHNAPLISIVQDSLVGSYIMTQKDKFMTQDSFQKFMMFLSYPDANYRQDYGSVINRSLLAGESNDAYSFDNSSSQESSVQQAQSSFYAGTNNIDNPFLAINTPQPAVLYPQTLWTGKQLFSMSLPTQINLDIGGRNADNINSDTCQIILQGELLTGVASNKVIGQAQGGLIHVLWKDFSPEYCRSFLDNCQRTVTNFMIEHSFSIGFGDMIISQKAKDQANVIQENLSIACQNTIYDSINNKIQLAPGQTKENGFEGTFNRQLQQSQEQLEKVVKADLSKRNALICMVNSGSKGKVFNIMQISTCLGQQYLHGQRMNFKFATYRSLPHFLPYNFDMASRGYVAHSYMFGLDPCEFFFHMIGGREGVCDTAIKTADSGYVERKMMKNMESLGLAYDNSVRNDVNHIVQFRYGDDSLDPHMCETQSYKSIGFSDKQFSKEFFINYEESCKNLTAEVFGMQKQKEFNIPSFIELIDRLQNVNEIGIADFQFQDQIFNQFSINVDLDLFSINSLQTYLQFHVKTYLNNTKVDVNSVIEDTQVLSGEQNITLLKLEYLSLLIERFWMHNIEVYSLKVNNTLSSNDIGTKTTICDIKRVINKQIVKNKLDLNINESRQTDLSPIYVVQEVNKLISFMKQRKHNESKLFRVILRQQLCSKNIVFNLRLKRSQFDQIIEELQYKFLKSACQPGEPVGPLASHSISEPATQLTLNTFHTAGTSALGSLGLPRLKELIDFRNTPIPIMSIYLDLDKKDIFAETQDQDKERQSLQGQKLMELAARLENTYFSDLIDSWAIEFDPLDSDSLIPQDKHWLSLKEQFGFCQCVEETSPFVIRYEISLKKLIEKEDAGFTVQHISDIISAYFYVTDETGGPLVSYYNGIGQIVIRVRPLLDPEILTVDIKEAIEMNDIIQKIHIGGLESIKKVFRDNYTPVIGYGLDDCSPSKQADSEDTNYIDRYGGIYFKNLKYTDGDVSNDVIKELFIRTEGSDLLSVLNMEGVDSYRTYCNDLPEIYTVLGTEACRSLLVKEMRVTLPSDGLNGRHFSMLADIMMSHPQDGKMVSINRHGMHITDTGVLTQASFEQPGDVLLDAGAFALKDNCQAISSAVLMGAEMRHGTGAFDLLLDTSVLPQPPETAHPQSALLSMQQSQQAKNDNVSHAEMSVNNNVYSAQFSAMGALSAGFIGSISAGSQRSMRSNSFLSNNGSRIGSHFNSGSHVSQLSNQLSRRSNSASAVIHYENDEYARAAVNSLDNSHSSRSSASHNSIISQRSRSMGSSRSGANSLSNSASSQNAGNNVNDQNDLF
ncbi:DNA-directed RNA polymerase subunit [Spironucleus salmonicida]|uniref:DNA-directed RNA polymerase subunit n=1 Tax=Spironucleus salmonicida TaxID=348837 RepID=V6LVF5_9EUKA|nr:DNA-directed RNA polymerase subunit [Spironucleus salmonicida]|eukprot:EST48632.1 DNA-directed RNA polymerase II largest subunit RPB1 [Spironucleus salmonicida]